MIMRSPDLEGSSTIAAAPSTSPTPTPSSPSLTRTPRWGSIRQRFSSIQSRDSISANADSVDDGMWDKNDTAFLEEVARASPLLLASPDRSDSLAPVLEHDQSRLPIHLSSRTFEDASHSSYSRRSMQPQPSSASSSTPSSAASATSATSTPVVSNEDVSGASPVHGYSKPWPRTMRRMASATVLPDLPEQKRADDLVSFRRPSTASSSPQLLPPIGPSTPLMSDNFATAHGFQSPNGRSTTHSSLRSSPSLSHSIHAGPDMTRSALAEQYPRSPSIHSASSYTAAGFSWKESAIHPEGRARASSSTSDFGDALAPPIVGIDRRTSRSVVGSPLAQASHFFATASRSPDASIRSRSSISTRPTTAPEGSVTRQSSGFSRATEPFPAGQDFGMGDSDDHGTASPRGKRMATTSMRGVPGSPTKKSASIASPTAAHATFSSTPVAAESPTVTAPDVRKHTKNKSSLVSGLRRLMGRREREARSAAPPLEISSPQQFADAPSADKVVSRGPDLAPSRFSDASATLRSRALRMDGAPSPGGLNLLGLADDAFGPDNALPRLRTHVEDSPSRSNGQDDNMRASPNLARRSPSLDLLRGFGGLSKVASPIYSVAGQAGSAADPASPRSRTKSIDGLARPLRDVLTHRPRRESTTRGASRTSVIEHISHEEARRLTGSAGPTILRTREAVEEHRSTYASFPSEIGLPDRAHFDLHQSGSPAPRSQVLEDATSMAEQSASQAATHAPSRPQRPHDRDALMAPPQDKPGQPSSGTGAGSSNRGGVSSSGSSFTSTSSAITDSAGAQRTPFSFQSQAYRPLSRDLRGDSKTMSGSPASASSLGFHLSGDLAGLGPGAFDSGRGLHRPSSSTGSQYALASARGGLPAQTASSMMPPPSLSSSDTAKRGHASRRSLNSLVGSKPWSSLLGSPHMGGGLALGSSSSQRKRVSTMAISRPMSVSTSAFSTDATDLSPDRCADLTLRPSDFEGARSRLRVDSTLSNFSEPSQWEPPSGPLGVALTPHAATAESSASSHHSHHSHRSHRSFQSHRLAPTSSNSALRQPTLGKASRPTTGEGFSLDHHSSPSLAAGVISAHLDEPPSLNRSSSLKGLSNVRTTDSSVFVPTLAAAAPISTRSTPRPLSSGSVLAHRKRPSFGLAIEPAAHSAFDSIPSPLLRTRRGSLALPDGSNSGRPFSSSSASAGRTTSDSSSRTSLIQSARASAGTLSSHHTFASDDKLEVETVRDGSPTKLPSDQPSPLRDDSVAELEIAMSAVLLRPPSSSHRHSVSVPMDEGDSPRQHQEESWSRATGATQGSRQPTTSRVFMIHSPNEEASASPSSGRLSQATKDIAFGSIAGMVSKVFEHPFDLVKVRLQTQSADRPPRYAGAFDCFKQTYLQEGIRGLYRGLSMPVLGATLENACLFFTYNQIQSAIRWANGEASMASAAQADAEAPLSMAQLGIAAAGAGSVTSLVLTPIELIKCKMQVQMITREQQAPLASSSSHAAGAATTGAQLQQQRSLYTSAVRSSAGGSQASAQAFKTLDGPLTLLRRTVATDGIRGLWLGQTGTLLRETGGGVAWFLAFEGCSRYLIARKRAQQRRNDITKKDLSSLELVGAGALAGISYNVVLFPADCVKSTMQTEQEMRAASHGAVAGQKWKGTGFFDTFKKIYTTRGVRGLYAGCGVTCLRSAPSSAIIFLMYNKLEKLSDSYGL